MAVHVDVNPHLIGIDYAMRGPIPERAAALRAQGRNIIPCHLGNPHSLGQWPITFYRQVLSFLEDPRRIDWERRIRRALQSNPSAIAGMTESELASEYVLQRAEALLAGFEAGPGAYTETRGARFIREAISRYIDRRDAGTEPIVPANPEHIYLIDGASQGAQYIIELLIAKDTDGIMLPIPQYPLYAASVKRCGGVAVGYPLDEARGWTLDRATLEASFGNATRQGIRPKAIAVINPGNPTGTVLSKAAIRQVIEFAEAHHLAIIADEVYQQNVYEGEFWSFARVLGHRRIPLFSLHSTSKGFHGECGRRGGYLEVRNPPVIQDGQTSLLDVLLKRASLNLCPNTVGQALTYLMVSPPEPGSAPYERYTAEREGILRKLRDKALFIKDAFAHMTGVSCSGQIGSMYLFPRLTRLPPQTTDFDYCMELLEKTGLVTVNGSGFGQPPGTHHLRVAFLPDRHVLAAVLPHWIEYHNAYVT